MYLEEKRVAVTLCSHLYTRGTLQCVTRNGMLDLKIRIVVILLN